jgi:hypothetical protein
LGDTSIVIDTPRPNPGRLAFVGFVVALVAAGCGSKSTTPTGPPTATFSAIATASHAPTPSPTVDLGTAAVSAFVALVTKDGFSYQATFTGRSRHTTDTLPISNGLLQVSGDDVLVRATFTFPPDHRAAVEHRYVAGKAWIRYASGDPWSRLRFKPSDSMAAFAAINTKADVTYLGPVESGGKTFYRVSFRSAVVNPVMIPATNLTEGVLTTPKLTVLLDAAGRPIKGSAVIDGRGRISGQLQEIVIELTMTFTKVGQAVAIHAP